MYKSILKALLKCILWGMLWAVVFIGIGFFITRSEPYLRKNFLFEEGIVILICAALATFPTKPLTLSLQGCGQSNTQYVFNAYLDDPKLESVVEEPKYKSNVKSGLKYGLNKPSIVMGAIICILASHII